jgi:ABC-type Fe3+-hydroxamate transport system substrate-binding protein
MLTSVSWGRRRDSCRSSLGRVLTIPADPKRVVSIAYKEQDWLYELGVARAAVREWYGHYEHEINPWAADRVDGHAPEVIGAELNVEQIAALRPDLIVGVYSGMTEAVYEQPSRIAPTLAGPVGSTDYNEPWREVTRLIGTARGKAERVQENTTEIEGLFDKTRKDHPQFVGAELITATAWSTDPWVSTPRAIPDPSSSPSSAWRLPRRSTSSPRTARSAARCPSGSPWTI